MSGVDLIAKERERQINEENWTPKHDDIYSENELAIAGAIYASPSYLRYHTTNRVGAPADWPWHPEWWKPTPEDRIKELVKAGALIAAEIDRLQRRKQLKGCY